ncbi:MAG TPA: TIGR00730 family Rossman fold protein, partial [Woeseiaceae bacterium]
LHVVDSMHARKALMADLSDGFIALPGGFGTIEELVEVMTWAQLGFHAKPCGILNVGNYYDSLLAFFDRAHQEGFVRGAHRRMVVTSTHADELLQKMLAYCPEIESKWAD